jgi:hypothetical protein
MNKPLSEMMKRTLRMVYRAPNHRRQIAGYGMAPFLSAANALVRRGLLQSYQTGNFYVSDAGKPVAARLVAEFDGSSLPLSPAAEGRAEE